MKDALAGENTADADEDELKSVPLQKIIKTRAHSYLAHSWHV